MSQLLNLSAFTANMSWWWISNLSHGSETKQMFYIKGSKKERTQVSLHSIFLQTLYSLPKEWGKTHVALEFMF